jgi:ribosomal protein S18 acetylase RimI-like enzyme
MSADGSSAGVGLALRTGRPEDADHLAEVFVAAWRRGYRGIVPDRVLDALDAAAVAATLRASLSRPEQTAIVALGATGEVAGFTRVGPDPDEPERGQIYSLYVHPNASGGGIGRMLIERGLEVLGAGSRDVSLWVFEDNERARRLYSSCGFVAEGAKRVEAEFATEEIRMLRPAGAPPRPDRLSGAGRSA